MRLCEDAGLWRGQPLVHYSGRQSFPPSWITSDFFFFFPSFPPSPRELSKKTGHTEQSQQAGSFPFTFLCPLEAKVVSCLWPEVYWGCPFCPMLPRCWCGAGLTPLPISQGRTWFSFHLWKWAQTTGPGCTQTHFSQLPHLKEDSVAMASGRRITLVSPFYQLIGKAVEQCPCISPSIAVKIPEDDSQFGKLYWAFLLLERKLSASERCSRAMETNTWQC